MSTTGASRETGSDALPSFVAMVQATETEPDSIARLVLHGAAAASDRRDVAASRAILVAAVRALRDRNLRVAILVTPAGFVDHKPGGAWPGTAGWETTQADFDELAAVAATVAGELVSSNVRELARETVGHLIIGVDVWPTDDREPHAEVACLYDVDAGSVSPVTGKSYPNTAQQGDLIRNPDVASHLIEIDGRTIAVLVCHDLAAWSPRGNAVAKGVRATTWRGMQDAVAAKRPTLAIQLPHTVDTAATWRGAWSRFAERSGGRLTSATTAIRHLDRSYKPVPGPIDPRFLGQTGRGERVVDILVAGDGEI